MAGLKYYTIKVPIMRFSIIIVCVYARILTRNTTGKLKINIKIFIFLNIKNNNYYKLIDRNTKTYRYNII